MRILYIEDDDSLRSYVLKALKRERHAVDGAAKAADGFRLLKEYSYDIILLDIGMPDMDGLSVLRKLKEDHPNMPVIVISGQGAEETKLEAFNLGAADYMTKPFFLSEMVVRVRREIDRHQNSSTKPKTDGSELEAGPIKLEMFKRRAIIRGREVALTPKEFMILELLVRRAGRIVTQEALGNACWNLDYQTGTNVVEVHVNRLRKKIDMKGKPSLIVTVREGGYMVDNNHD